MGTKGNILGVSNRKNHSNIRSVRVDITTLVELQILGRRDSPEELRERSDQTAEDAASDGSAKTRIDGYCYRWD